jgi:hypothetical protein
MDGEINKITSIEQLELGTTFLTLLYEKSMRGENFERELEVGINMNRYSGERMRWTVPHEIFELILKLIDMAHALYEQDNVSLWASNSIV